ncbi:replication-associated recombination protein A [bacterium]|nr:replication-associated recombination protein A [bacterium]
MNQDSLFDAPSLQSPLAHRMRPQNLDAIEGQQHFLNARFRQLLASDNWTGFIFWGPPGCGKTTLANVVAQITRRPFHTLSAVTSGVKDIREVLDLSRRDHRAGRPAWVLFIDEVHRLNKAQQDVLLPYLEDGSIRFIGATTENPSFEINNAIASRSTIFRFKALETPDLQRVITRAIPQGREVSPEVIDQLALAANGDARRGLTLLEHLLLSLEPGKRIELADWEGLAHAQSVYYDKKSEGHYDTISAFIKSVRGSDPDAAVYYLAVMLEGGEDPLFIARRLLLLASEDVGNANPAALMVANSAFQAVHAIGMPEARIVLAHATTYLACSEKSNRSYRAIEDALEVVRTRGNLEIPYAIRNAPTAAMKDWGYGKGYVYPHDHDGGWAPAQYLPDAIKDRRFYKPSGNGSEKKLQEFLKERGKN